MQDAPTPMLSVVIPMYRESARIGPTLRDVIDTLAERAEPSEVVLVDDGSTDDTVAVVQPFLTERGRGSLTAVRLVRFEANRGKGAAVRAGLEAARGRWRLMMDADNAARVCEVDKLLARVTERAGIVAGSRSVEGSVVDAKGFRKLTGLLFKTALRLMGLRLARDTQCGFKLYRADVARLVAARGVEDGFAFDLEHLLLAGLAGTSVEEVGIRWRHIDGGQISPIRDGLKMLGRAARIRARDYGSIAFEPEQAGAEAQIEAKPAAMATARGGDRV